MVTTHPVTGARTDELPDTAVVPSVPPVRVPAYRYTDPGFAAREHEAVWPRVWQLACTVDHVVEAGDFYEYRCGPLSVLVVRGADGALRAFQNVCRHRGNTICQGAGSGLAELRCGFHRWAWDLEGNLREVPSRRSFGPGLRNEDFPLLRARVDTWGPLVFVNLDLDAMPLADYLDGAPSDAAWADLDEFRCDTAVITPAPANWKVVAEGFSETYHVQGIHPEMLRSVDDVHAPQRLWRHAGVSYQRYGVPSPRVGRAVTDQEVWDSFLVTQGARMGMTHEACPVPPACDGESVRDVIAARIREHQATRGVDLSRFTTDQILTLSQYNVFPNVTVLVWGDMLNALVARPGPSPDEAEFGIYTLYRAAPGTRRARVEDIVVPNDVDFGLVMGQDVGIMRTAQRGLHQPGLTHLTVGSEEARVVNLHRNLERYLGIEPSELLPLGG